MVDIHPMLSCGLLLAAACGSSTAGPDGPAGLDAPHTGSSGMPGVGAYAVNYYTSGTAASSITTPAMTTQPTGSTIVVGVGRGIIGSFNDTTALPTDTMGNAPYQELGIPHPFQRWMTSGTAIYAFPAARGGPGFTVSTTTGAADEITLATVEVIGRTQIQASEWNEVTQPATGPEVALTSQSVTTTGPATLVAFWWGDADEFNDQTAVPDNGFVVVDKVLTIGQLVQCAVAVRDVTTADTYHVTWAATPRQGAQLWLIAIQ
jgi:hypothetical protein